MHPDMIEGAPRDPDSSTDGLPVRQVMLLPETDDAHLPEVSSWITGRMVAYGLPPRRYRELMAEQSGACRICRQTPKEPLMIDHCHATGKVRGLLCRRCNCGLGFFRDNSASLRVAADYIESFQK